MGVVVNNVNNMTSGLGKTSQNYDGNAIIT